MQKTDGGHFQICQEVTVSGQFYGWLVGLGPGVKILEPRDVVEEFQARLRETLG